MDHSVWGNVSSQDLSPCLYSYEILGEIMTCPRLAMNNIVTWAAKSMPVTLLNLFPSCCSHTKMFGCNRKNFSWAKGRSLQLISSKFEWIVFINENYFEKHCYQALLLSSAEGMQALWVLRSCGSQWIGSVFPVWLNEKFPKNQETNQENCLVRFKLTTWSFFCLWHQVFILEAEPVTQNREYMAKA